MMTIARRIVRQESRAAQGRAELKVRIQFVGVGEVPGTRGPVAGVMLWGDGWSDAEREAAQREDAEPARR